MQAKNLYKKKILRLYAMDRNSDRFRICPNDGEEFMANDRREKYCSEECADEYHNILKKAKKEQLQQYDPSSKKSPNEQNIIILSKLTIHNDGSIFDIDFLIKSGFDFSSYNERKLLLDFQPDLNCHYLQFGIYQIYRVESSKVLIKPIIQY